MAKKGKYTSALELSGVSELLNKIEKAGGSVDDAVKKAVDDSLELVGRDMKLFMVGHKDTGRTYDSYEQVKATINDGKVEAKVGFRVKKGGLPAIFLDVGTPKQKPYFFRYHALEDNRAQIEQIQRNALNDILKGLK